MKDSAVNETAAAADAIDPTDTAGEAPRGETTVTPQTFGAVGDGKNDDVNALRETIRYAKENGLTVTLPEAEYFTSAPLDVGDITIISENAKISYHGLQQSVPAVNMLDNAKIYGTIHIWSVDNERSNHGGRCGMGFGVYGTGEGVSGCYVEHVVVTGGVPDANGVFITGDSHDITIDKVTVPPGTNITRAVLVHWGNSNDHYVTKHHVSCGHVENWKPTTHPHDIHIGSIEATELGRNSTALGTPTCVLWISGAYDVTVDEVIGTDADYLLSVGGGDLAFAYASEEEQVFGSRNILVKKAVGNGIKTVGFYAVGYSPYTPEDPLLQITVEEAVINGSGNTYAAAVHKVEKFEIGKLTVRDCSATVLHFGAGCRNVSVDHLTAENCTGRILHVTSKPHERFAENFTFGRMDITGCRSAGQSAVTLERVIGVRIGEMNVRDSSFSAAMTLYATAQNVRMDALSAPDAFSVALVQAAESISVVNNISIGKADCGDAAVSAGADCMIAVGN